MIVFTSALNIKVWFEISKVHRHAPLGGTLHTNHRL
jgi:hypothetical protein